jgi:hypothetical protein
MHKPKGSIYISIGSMGMVVLAGIGALLSPFVMALASWLGKLIRELDLTMTGPLADQGLAAAFAGRLVGGLGVAIGILLLLMSGLQLTFGLLVWRRRDDLVRTTFPLAVGIAFSILSLPAGLTAWGLIQLVFPVLVIVGAALNHQEAAERARAYYYPAQAPPAPPAASPQPPADPLPEGEAAAEQEKD